MKLNKLALSTALATLLIVSTSLSFAQAKSIDLEEAISLSKENSTAIRALENQEFSVKNNIRHNIQQSYIAGNSLDSYYDYINTYEDAVIDDDHVFNKYIGRSNSYLKVAYGNLQQEYMIYLSQSNLKAAEKKLDEMDFVGAYMKYGDTAGLTKESKYRNFKKDEAEKKNIVDQIQVEYTQSLIAADKATEAGTIKMYIALKNLQQGLALSKEMLSIYETGLDNMQISYEQGSVSELDLANREKTTEQERLSVQNMQYQYDNLLYQFNKMCGLPIKTPIKLSTEFTHTEFKTDSPETYYETAYNKDTDYLILKAKLTYNEKNFDVMNKYLLDIDKDNESDTPLKVYYQEKEDMKETLADLNLQLKNLEQEIQANIHYALNDIVEKETLAKYNNTALELATMQFESSQQSFNLGQLTQVSFDQAKLNYENAEYTAKQNKRAYDTAIEHFKLLINYGVTYE